MDNLLKDIDRSIEMLEQNAISPGILYEVSRTMRDLSHTLESLSHTAEAAIKAGDWKVDGARDPDAVLKRAAKLIA